MRRAVLFSVTLGLAGSGLRPAAAQAFQGMIRFTVQDANGHATEITQFSRPGKSSFTAVESGKPGGGMIIDSSAGTMTIIDGQEKSYMVINLVAMQQMMQGMAGMARGMQRGGGTDEPAPKGTITPTGRSEVVAGVTCQVYSYDGTSSEGKHETGEVCLAKGAGVMVGGQIPGQMPGMMGMQARQSMQQRLKAWGPLGTLLSQGYGILKATNNENGKPNGSLVVTAFQRGAPLEASFQPPAGYKEKSMSDMMGGSRRP